MTTSNPAASSAAAAAASAPTPKIVIIATKPSPQQLAECLADQQKFAEAVFDIYDHFAVHSNVTARACVLSRCLAHHD